MNTDKNDGIVGLLMKITVVLAVLKVLGILSIRWIEVFAPAGMAAAIVVLGLIGIWILGHWKRR